jgi:hypothetical protein
MTSWKTFPARALRVALVFVACAVGCASVPRIDGRSDAAFDRSHAKLVESLAPSDRLRLMLAEALLLSPRGCLTVEPIPGDAWMTDALGGQAVLRTCRTELDGLSFDDILALAYPAGPPEGDP